MTKTTLTLSDQAARERIKADIDATLFVEAGAGSGKTRALVERILALIADGTAMENIAAITFTEKAAAELRDRVREKLSSGETRRQLGDEVTDAALHQLDGAAVGTLHSFARRILSEHPVEAGLPPSVEVLDQISSQIDFEERWHSFLDRLLDDPDAGETLLRLEMLGVRLASIRSLAQALDEDWDRLEGLYPGTPPALSPIDVSALMVGSLERSRFEGFMKYCTDPSDGLYVRFVAVEQELNRLDDAPDDASRIEVLRAAMDASRGRASGFMSKWGGGEKGKAQKADALQALQRFAGPHKPGSGDQPSICQRVLDTAAREALESLMARLAIFTLEAAEERRADGRMEFHDLLVRARQLLRHETHGAEVRAALRDRYRYLLIDEFQDTDPIQVELAALLGCGDPAASSQLWPETAPDPGRLFFVGDPKQSIYRFRNADIAIFLQARRWVTNRAKGRVEGLSTNFRSAGPIIDWVNTVFAELIVETEGSQPAYAPLDSVRLAVEPGAAVSILGREPHAAAKPPSADDLRCFEAESVASAIDTMVDTGWQVDKGDALKRALRPAKLGDIAILLPTRTSLPHLEDALEAAGIPYRAEASSLVYNTREVRDLLLALQAVADPTDELALVAALRSPLYGCGDDDLAHWKLGCRGSFSLLGSQPDAAGHPVADGIAHLAALHDAKRWTNPATLLDRLVRERGAFETAVVGGRPRDVWRRLRFVIDQARAWADAGGTDLRSYLAWARMQGTDNARVTETVLPETDDESVRILTVHAAKGLEFPIVVLAGITGKLQNQSHGPKLAFDSEGSAVVRLRAGVSSAKYDEWKRLDDQMDADERLRLLYVACTRARDHLVVSLHRRMKFVENKDGEVEPKRLPGDKTAAWTLFEGGAIDAAEQHSPRFRDLDVRAASRDVTSPDEAPPLAGSDTPPGSRPEQPPSPAEPVSSARPSQPDGADAGAAARPAPSAGPAIAAPTGRSDTARAVGSTGLPDRAAWAHERDRALRSASVPETISATRLRSVADETVDAVLATDVAPPEPGDDIPGGGLHHDAKLSDLGDGAPDARRAQSTPPTEPSDESSDPGFAKDRDDSDTPPWKTGRGGTAIGSAVHAVLQDIDLRTGDDLEDLVERRCAAEGIGQTRVVRDLVRAALNTDTAREAARSQHWREIYVAAPVGGRLLESYIDLVYRVSQRLVVVDWKTDSIHGDDDIDAKLERYRLQGAAYVAALEAATGETVDRMVFVFINRDGAIEAEIPDLRTAITEVHALIPTSP